MQIQSNKIIFPTHVVVCNPAVADKEYMEEMANYLEADTRHETPREHARLLRNCNNDGTWSIKKTV